jgi:hypothetical protein
MCGAIKHAALLILILILAACSTPPTESPDAALDGAAVDQKTMDLASNDGDGTAAADTSWSPRVGVVFRGLGFSWQKTSHRLNKLGGTVEGTASGASLALKTTSVMEGGSWSTGQPASDKVDYEVGYTAVRTTAARFAEGTFAPLQVTGNAKATPEVVARAQRTERIDLAAHGLADAKEVVAVIRGFTIDTDLTHEDGYTTRGFTVRLLDPKREADEIVLKLEVRVHAGAVADRIQNLESYGAKVTVSYTLVALREPATIAKVGYKLDLAGGVNPVHDHADLTKAKQVLPLSPAPDAALVAFTGFEILLNPGETWFPGRYVREVRVMNEKLELGSGGALEVWTDGYFSNSGLVTHPTKVDFSAELAMIPLADTEAKLYHGEIKGEAGTSLTTDTKTISFQ